MGKVTGKVKEYDDQTSYYGWCPIDGDCFGRGNFISGNLPKTSIPSIKILSSKTMLGA